MKKYLVTGGLGFIGKHLTNKLSQKNSVIVVDDKSNGNLKNLKKNKNIKIILAKIQKLKKNKQYRRNFPFLRTIVSTKIN